MPAIRKRFAPMTRSQPWLFLTVLLASSLITMGCSSSTPPQTQTSSDGSDAADAPQNVDSPAEQAESEAADSSSQEASSDQASTGSDDCSGGVVLDDGTVESGYGFVPSSKWAVYAQEFDAADFPSREITKVCVCFLRTRPVDSADFEVVFYEQQGDGPAVEPYANVEGHAADVPNGVANAGRFYSVDVEGVTLPEGKSYIGVRFDPSKARFFFVCNNKTPEEPVINGFQKDDRSKRWTNVLRTGDSTFTGHRSAMIRAEAAPAKKDGQ